jgi:hypothetical protein
LPFQEVPEACVLFSPDGTYSVYAGQLEVAETSDPETAIAELLRLIPE